MFIRGVEHGVHVLDAGRVEAQRLVERRRGDEHVAHVRDAGRVEAQRLVERRRALKQGARGCEGYQAQAACRMWVRPEVEGTGQVWCGAHLEHLGLPVGNVRVEVLQVVEEVAHVGDARDVPLGDGAVRRFGGGHVGVVFLDRRLQGGLGVTEQAAVVGG
eukprot:scaffold1038_cov49-Phaeocystis_antarctica.AAC.2